MHVTLRLRAGLPSLRRAGEHGVFRGAVADAQGRAGTTGKSFRIIHYTCLSNHVHMIVEASGALALARGTQGFAIRMAKRLNRWWGRKGKVFEDRFHDRILRTPREVRSRLRYVLLNAQRHGVRHRERIDPYSSGRSFDGWAGRARPALLGPVVAAGTWLLRVGWRRLGLIRASEPRGSP